MQTWRYHKERGAKVFDTDCDDMEQLAKDGWCESPADFGTPKAVVDENDTDTGDLLEQFNSDPEALTKDQHVELAASMGLKLTKSMKESTMIEKIKEHMSNGDDEAAN